MGHQIWEKAVEIFRKPIDFLKKGVRKGLNIKLPRKSCAKTLQHPVQSIAAGISVQELPGQHFWESFLKDWRHFRGPVFELLVGLLREYLKRFVRVFFPMNGQEVIVQNIHKRGRVPPGQWPYPGHASIGERVVVGIGVDGTVQQDTVLNRPGITLPIMPFHKIANKVAKQEVFVAEGEEAVG